MIKPDAQRHLESLVFRMGASFLGKTKGRSLVGKWAKEKHSFKEIGEALIAANDQDRSSDVAYIQAILNGKTEERVEAAKIPFELKILVNDHIEMETRGTWEAICERLLKVVGQDTYSSWFNGMKLESWTIFAPPYISLPNEFVRSKLSGGIFHAQLSEALKGRPFELTVR